MGSSGWSIDLEPIEGSTPAPWSAVHDVTMRTLRAAWRKALPAAMSRHAWGWVSLGEDSLLVIGDRGHVRDERVSRIVFWFYDSVTWPSELADHWLSTALAEKRESLEADLAGLGYRIRPGSGYPELGKHRYRFIATKQRIGYADDEGVFWALPECTFQPSAELSADERARAGRSRAGGACECPYCVRLGLGPTTELSELPDWLCELPALEVLFLSLGKVGDDPGRFCALEKATGLKALVLVGCGEGKLPFDLTGLEKLETLCISYTGIQAADGLPRLPRTLRRFFHDAPEEVVDVPGAISDVNIFRTWDAKTFYRSLLSREDVEWWLARFAEADLCDPLGARPGT